MIAATLGLVRKVDLGAMSQDTIGEDKCANVFIVTLGPVRIVILSAMLHDAISEIVFQLHKWKIQST